MPCDEQTEQPTQRKLQDSRKKGKVAYSKEVTNVLMIAVYTVIFAWLIPNILYKLTIQLKTFIELSHQFTQDNLLHISGDILGDVAYILALPIFLIIIVGIMSNITQIGFIFSIETLTPKLSKISIKSGLQRIFSSKSIVELVSSILKLTLISILLFILIKSELAELKVLYSLSFQGIIHFIHRVIIKIMIGVIIIMGLISVLDLLYRRIYHIRELRMSKHEVKEELKHTEGKPEIKAKLREMRKNIADFNINQAIKQADVVITNPDHFAVALQYNMEEMNAPKVVAKGQGNMALTIKTLAKHLNVIIVENKTLARLLFNTVKVGELIPERYYQAVAKIINYVYQTRNRPIF